MDQSDEKLLAAAREGDRKAIDELLTKHEQQIYRFGLRMCGDEQAAQEVLQETLVAAFRNLPGFRGDAALSTWLYQIARSFCVKERRRHRPEVPLSDHALTVAATAPQPDSAAHAREIGRALSAAIGALPADQREVVVLRDVEGLTAEEAAEVVGVEVGALKSRLHRARVALRANLVALLGERELDGAPPCAELLEELSAYASAEIDQATCIRVEEHLARCPRCAGACEALKETISLCRELPGGEVPAAVRDAVRRALQAVLRSVGA